MTTSCGQLVYLALSVCIATPIKGYYFIGLVAT